ncbi:mechanosensitive ion channel domain-containing protein [Sulfitobacter sp. LCG007]
MRIARILKFHALVLAALAWFALGAGADAQTLNTASPSEAEGSAQSDEPAPLAALLEVLKDPDARDRLIAELEKSQAPSGEATDGEDDSTVAGDILSFGSRIAVFTQTTVQDAAAAVLELRDQLLSGRSVFEGLSAGNLDVLLDALRGLALIILCTVSLFVLLRWLTRDFHRRLGARAAQADFMRSVGLFVGSNVAGALVVLLAWALGYAVALFLIGSPGQIGIRQALYLNAFLVVELIKVAIRSVLSPIAGDLRIIPVGDRAAGALSRYLSVVVSILGYGHLLVIPIVNQSAGRPAGNAVSAVLTVIVLAYLAYVVLRRRREVASWLETTADPRLALDAAAEETDGAPSPALQEYPPTPPGPVARGLAALGRYWHWAALAYLAGMFLVVMTQPADVTYAALVGLGKILVAGVIAALLSGWLARAIARGISLPEDVSAKLPLLERRLNRVMPRAFSVLRLVLMFCVLIFALDVIGLLDMRAWLETRVGIQVTATLFSVALILLFAFALWLALTSFVDYRLNPEYGSVPTARETTLLTLLRNAATILLLVLTLMFVLSEIGLDIGPLLASAGVVGLAVGFGSQKLVQDIINGVFIQFENAMNVGDVVTAGATTGVVERLSVRSVSLRDLHGVYHIIPFSSVDLVSNFMKEFSYSVCDMGVAYREDVEDVKAAMHDAFALMKQDEEMARDVLGDLEWFGVEAFGDNAVVLRARIKTRPGKQWGIGRAYNGALKTVFDERGIEIPFPQRTLWLGEGKDGSSQALRIATAESPRRTRAPERRPEGDEGQGPRDYDIPESPGEDR